MSDLISRSELIEEIERQKNNVENDGTWSYFTTMKIAELFEEIVNREPIVEAKPVVHGSWETEFTALLVVYRCSECNCATALGQTNFCPNCGADMRGGKNE